MLGQGIGARARRCCVTRANGCPAVGSYKPRAHGDGWEPFNLAVLEIEDGEISASTTSSIPSCSAVRAARDAHGAIVDSVNVTVLL